MNNKYVYVVDDDTEVCDALSCLLEAEGLQVKPFLSGEEFLKIADRGMRGCVILDIRLPNISGLQIQTLLKERDIDIPIIFLTGHGDIPMSSRAFRAGAVDFLQKPCSDRELIKRVHEAMDIDAHISQRKFNRADLQERFSRLSKREKEILVHVIAGNSSKEVGKILGISNRTVEVHRYNILKKMDAKSVTELAFMGYELGLVDR